ncbi:MAG: CvpA family protein [Burkholderiaceae bacterium]
MATLDWVFIGVMVASMLMGAWRGLVVELLSLGNWAAAFVLAQWLAAEVAFRLPMASAPEAMRHAAAFGLVFVVALLLGSILIWLVGKLFQVAALRPADRALGAAFGVLRGGVLLLAAAVIVGLTPLKAEPWWTGSTLAGWATATLRGLKPVLPQEFGKYLP